MGTLKVNGNIESSNVIFGNSIWSSTGYIGISMPDNKNFYMYGASDGSRGIYDDTYGQIINFSKGYPNFYGNANSATKWAAARTITIGHKACTLDGSSDLTYSPVDIFWNTSNVTSTTDWNAILTPGVQMVHGGSGFTGTGNPGGTYYYGGLYTIGLGGTQEHGHIAQFYIPHTMSGSQGIIYRSGWYKTYNSWYTLLDSRNYTSYTVTKTGSGASGTWGISISGNAASASSVAWGSITGKPSTFSPSSHTHDYVPYGVNHGTGLNFNTVTSSGFHRVNSGNTNGPSVVSDWGQLLVIHGGGDTITQIYGDFSSGNLFTRSGNPPDVGGAGSWTSWKQLLNSDNYSNYCLPLSGGTMTGRITLASTGFQTNNVAGYYLDQYGNFFHSRASTGDHWQFHSYDQSISLKYYADLGDLLVPHIMKTQSITLTSTGAITFYGAGSGTYNCSAIYVDTTHGFQIETPRLTDSASGTVLPCKILTRGGVPAPIHYSYAVSTNYGTGIPGTSTPGYGVVGAIYYKIY